MKKQKSFLTKIILCTACITMSVGLMSPVVSAESSNYYLTDNELEYCYMPSSYEVVKTIGTLNNGMSFSGALDLFMHENGCLYVLDTDNSRVIQLDADFNVKKVYEGNYGEDGQPLSKPEGIYVGVREDLYIADTGNGRIVHLDKDGNYIESFVQPTDPTYDTSYPFKPSKVYVDELGKLYVLNSSDYHGIIVMDGSNDFLGYLGATKISFSLTDQLLKIFASEEQKEQITRKVPAYFSNFLLKDGMIYATSFWDDSNQIKILTPSGDNIYTQKFFGETNELTTFNYQPGFNDIAVDENGIIYAADMTVNKIYVYDQEGNNLTVFGGTGVREGNFNSISSLAVDKSGRLYVLDKTLNVIQIFKPTELMENIISATTLFNAGKYDEAEIPWQKVKESDAASGLANRGLAKSAYRSGDLDSAMELSKISLDKKIYSDAFADARLDVIREYFVFVFLGAVVTVVLLAFVLGKLKSKADIIAAQPLTTNGTVGKKEYLKLALLVFFHPIDGFDKIKRDRKKIKVYPILACLLLLILVRSVYVYLVHFPVSPYSVYNLDVFQELILLMVPLLSWIIINYAVSSIMEGKQTFKETLFASLYSFLPYIVLMLPLGAVSHLLCADESGLYTILTGIVTVWSILLLLLSNKIMNEFTFGKMVAVVLITIFGIICFWMLILLFYIIISQSLTFFGDIYSDIAMIFYN